MLLRNRLASFCLLLVAGIAACDKTEERDPQFEPATAEKPFVPVNNPPTDLPPDAQKLLVPGKPAVNEPIDLVRDLGRLLEGITDRATATEKRMAVDGRMLALRKKLPDWEKPEGAVRAMLKEKGDDGVTVADRVLAQANAVLAIADAQPVHAYLQQLCVMLK
jgi:hypothetical protein